MHAKSLSCVSFLPDRSHPKFWKKHSFSVEFYFSSNRDQKWWKLVIFEQSTINLTNITTIYHHVTHEVPWRHHEKWHQMLHHGRVHPHLRWQWEVTQVCQGYLDPQSWTLPEKRMVGRGFFFWARQIFRGQLSKLPGSMRLWVGVSNKSGLEDDVLVFWAWGCFCEVRKNS